jgi:subtilase family serine protease
MLRRHVATSAAALLIGLFLSNFNSFAQDRISGAIDGQRTVTLTGNRHPLARAEFDAGRVAPDFRMDRMILVLQPDAATAASLNALLEAQHDSASPQFQRWLEPSDFETQFGASRSDVARVTEWLTSQGFSIDEIPAGRRSIVFSGSAAQVETAFHTQMRRYRVAGELHHANATDPQIPQALAGVVAGAVSLHDFPRTALHTRRQSAPEFSSGSSHYLTPADFATIYDVAALYSSGITGSGQTLAIVGRTNINVSDVAAFRSQWGLPVNNPQVIVNGTNPGIVSTDEEVEADLDVEWSGAVAQLATVKFVVSASTNTTDGVDLSAQYIVSNNVAPVLSVSFGSCESQIGSAERAFYNNLWQQAAAEGITAFIASGDSGAAGCDSPSETTASYGQAVNGLCSSPYSVCVGGTELNEAGNNNLYWSASNTASGGSALSYIPEVAWNESASNGGSGLWATGGGASAYYSKPSWQSGTGVPADARRDVPDVSLTTAGHDGYLVDVQGSYYTVSGTSAASPSFAGLMALVNQKAGARQGNINTVLYPLATLATSGGAKIFHSITGGNNTVPGATGFTAGAHYNQATGLGSPDAFVLVNHWKDSSTATPTNPSTASFTLSTASTISLTPGAHGTVTVTSAVSGGFNSAIALSLSGLPSGVTASFAPASFPAGSGSSTLTLTASSSIAVGVYQLIITGTGAALQKTSTLALTIAQPFSVAPSASSISLAHGTSGAVTISTTVNSGFSGAIALAAKPPAGVTTTFAPATIASPGRGSSQLTVSIAAAAAPGTYLIPITATNGSMVETTSLTVVVTAPATFTLKATPSTVSIRQGGTGSTVLSIAPVGGFSGTVTVSYGAPPSGVTARWSNVSGGAQLTFTASSSAAIGSFPITITATSPGITPSPTVVVTLTVAH